MMKEEKEKKETINESKPVELKIPKLKMSLKTAENPQMKKMMVKKIRVVV